MKHALVPASALNPPMPAFQVVGCEKFGRKQTIYDQGG